MEHPSHPVESHWRTSLRNRIIQASSLLEVLLSGLVLIGLLFSVVPLIRWMPGLQFDGNEAEIRTFLERSLDIVIGIEFIKMLAKHSPGSSLEVLLYAIARHLVVGHDSAVDKLRDTQREERGEMRLPPAGKGSAEGKRGRRYSSLPG